uniref:PTTG1 interacting protein n=1 Tax=Ornithorhynchus anatinus TaxID=9258 RepID=A0A6I8PEF3_ORNAN
CPEPRSGQCPWGLCLTRKDPVAGELCCYWESGWVLCFFVACANFSKESCEDCLRNISCLWCSTKETCLDYPVSSLLPSSSLCPLADTRWAACWINLEALVIAISVIVGILLLSVTICCCYCCYCRKRARRLDDDEDRLTRQREERRMQSLQRKHERKKQHDEIRKKYGLLQDSDHPYSRLEND